MAQNFSSIEKSLEMENKNKLKLKSKSIKIMLSSSIAVKAASTAGSTGPICLFKGAHADGGSGGRNCPVHAAGVDLHLVACWNKDFLSYFTSALSFGNSRLSYGASATDASSSIGARFPRSWGDGRSARASTRPLSCKLHLDRLRGRPAAVGLAPC